MLLPSFSEVNDLDQIQSFGLTITTVSHQKLLSNNNPLQNLKPPKIWIGIFLLWFYQWVMASKSRPMFQKPPGHTQQKPWEYSKHYLRTWKKINQKIQTFIKLVNVGVVRVASQGRSIFHATEVPSYQMSSSINQLPFIPGPPPVNNTK